MSYRTALSRIMSGVIEPGAERVRTHGAFPRASVAALGHSGLLALTVSAELGGRGLGPAEAAEVVAEVSRACPATGAVLRSHYVAVAVIEAHGIHWVRRRIAAGHHLSTLALAEAVGSGERGVPPGPPSTATRTGDVVALCARKRDVVAAGEADSYVWSSRPADGSDGLSLWLVPADAPGLFVPARPDGEGPRGCVSSTVRADPVLVPAGAMLGPSGGGIDAVLGAVLPWLAALPAPGMAVARPAGVNMPARSPTCALEERAASA
ncbi:acyl-CoA dehydrogenase family protein [Streptomyces sp. NPDC014889]|uniref:acyl-CoA dehydrogenase family protein n=1 Tax=Streptomyces sp. NPDC014889 TaxID=3364928 RepID=UPI0036FBD0CC